VTVVSWKPFFCGWLGHNITFFSIANSRKSISEALKRCNGIGSMLADKVLGQFEQQPEHMKYVTPASLCPTDYPGRYQVVSVPFEPKVDISPLVFHPFKRCDWLWMEKSKRISKCPWDEIIFAFLLTNNIFRFHLFCVLI
jgi:hypothetical protein